MAFSEETARALAELRVSLDAILDAQTRQLTQAWVTAFDTLAPVLAAAVQDILDLAPGTWPTAAQLATVSRAQQALALSAAELDRLTVDVGVMVTRDIHDAVDVAVTAQPRLIASMLPPEAGDPAVLAVRFDRVSPEAVRAIVQRSTEQVTSLTQPLTAEATDRMKRALVRGVVVGDNPRAAAAQMLTRLERGFNGGLTRALVVSRTEMLDAHRDGAAAQQRANPDVLQGWVWFCQCDKRSCPACFAMHGSEHPPDEDGPLDHQQGRCARVPQTRSWRDLGFNIDEPPSLLEGGRQQFEALAPADQLDVMGPGRLAALKSGDVAWTDLAVKRSTPGWRDSYAPTPVQALRR